MVAGGLVLLALLITNHPASQKESALPQCDTGSAIRCEASHFAHPVRPLRFRNPIGENVRVRVAFARPDFRARRHLPGGRNRICVSCVLPCTAPAATLSLNYLKNRSWREPRTTRKQRGQINASPTPNAASNGGAANSSAGPSRSCLSRLSRFHLRNLGLWMFWGEYSVCRPAWPCALVRPWLSGGAPRTASRSRTMPQLCQFRRRTGKQKRTRQDWRAQKESKGSRLLA